MRHNAPYSNPFTETQLQGLIMFLRKDKIKREIIDHFKRGIDIKTGKIPKRKPGFFTHIDKSFDKKKGTAKGFFQKNKGKKILIVALPEVEVLIKQFEQQKQKFKKENQKVQSTKTEFIEDSSNQISILLNQCLSKLNLIHFNDSKQRTVLKSIIRKIRELNEQMSPKSDIPIELINLEVESTEGTECVGLEDNINGNYESDDRYIK